MKHQVIVGNIGTVLDTDTASEAVACYMSYQDKSLRGEGRAAGEPVTLMTDGEPVTLMTDGEPRAEHTPPYYPPKRLGGLDRTELIDLISELVRPLPYKSAEETRAFELLWMFIGDGMPFPGPEPLRDYLQNAYEL
jgi:hypothetical protein